MPTWWKPWTWQSGQSHADNFIRAGAGDAITRNFSDSDAVRLAAVLCALRVLGEGVAQVPLKVYRERDRDGLRTREPATDLGVYNILHRRPNGWMTSFEWRETMTMHAALWGNAYSVINRVNGEPDELIPVLPSDMQLRFKGAEVFYLATIEGQQFELDARDVLHLRGPSLDAVEGLRVVHIMREMLSMTRQLETSQSTWVSNGNRPTGVLAAKETTELSAERRAAFISNWKERFGPNGTGGIAVLDGDWTFQAMNMSAVDQQHLETRNFQIEEVARAFRVLPVMLMHAANSPTYASAEQFFQAHVVHTLGPWFERWENAIDKTFFPDDPSLYSHFNLNGLMRGTASDRSEYYTKALGSGGTAAWMTQNEVRALEEMDPLPGGDTLYRGSQNEGQDDGA